MTCMVTTFLTHSFYKLCEKWYKSPYMSAIKFVVHFCRLYLSFIIKWSDFVQQFPTITETETCSVFAYTDLCITRTICTLKCGMSIPFMAIYINSYTLISKYCLKSNVLFSKTKVAQKTNKCDKAQVPYGKCI